MFLNCDENDKGRFGVCQMQESDQGGAGLITCSLPYFSVFRYHQVMVKLTEKDVIQLIESDQWMMDVIRGAASLHLPDWWIGAGFVRNKVWDHLHGYSSRTPLGDIDVIYFDRNDISEDSEKELERKLAGIIPNLPWSVKNQARMHLANGDEPYSSSTDALSKWPETATSVAVSFGSDGRLILNAPHGVDDLVNLVVRPTPAFYGKKGIYAKRQETKDWRSKWPGLGYSLYRSYEHER